MRAKFIKITFTAALALATALTLSCSDDNGDGGNSVAVSSSSQKTNVSSSSEHGSSSSSSGLEVELPCEPPTITTASLPSATVGTAYSVTLAATGDTPISWSIQSGTLPAGLSLSGATISGTPTAAGTFNIVVRATNAGGYDQKSFSIAVEAAAIEPGEGLMYWGHIGDTGETFAEWMNWYIENGYIESSSITGTVKEIQFRENTGYRMILIPQSAGIPARIDDALGNNVKEAAFVPVSNLAVNGTPYYLFINNGSINDIGGSFMLTIKW